MVCLENALYKTILLFITGISHWETVHPYDDYAHHQLTLRSTTPPGADL